MDPYRRTTRIFEDPIGQQLPLPPERLPQAQGQGTISVLVRRTFDNMALAVNSVGQLTAWAFTSAFSLLTRRVEPFDLGTSMDVHFEQILTQWIDHGGVQANRPNREIAAARIRNVHYNLLPYLNLSGLELTSLPNCFVMESFLYLLYLDLSHNKFGEAPESDNDDDDEYAGFPRSMHWKRLQNLYSIDLQGNHLSAIPDWIDRCHKLVHLSLQNNRITELPDWLNDLFRNLRTLDVSHNQITELSKSITELLELEKIQIAHNPLRSVPVELQNAPSLCDIDIEGTPINPGLLDIAFDYCQRNRLNAYTFSVTKEKEDALFASLIACEGARAAKRQQMTPYEAAVAAHYRKTTAVQEMQEALLIIKNAQSRNPVRTLPDRDLEQLAREKLDAAKLNFHAAQQLLRVVQPDQMTIQEATRFALAEKLQASLDRRFEDSLRGTSLFSNDWFDAALQMHIAAQRRSTAALDRFYEWNPGLRENEEAFKKALFAGTYFAALLEMARADESDYIYEEEFDLHPLPGSAGPASAAGPRQALAENLNEWKSHCSDPHNLVFLLTLESHEQAMINTWLEQLYDADDFKYVKEQLAAIVCNILEDVRSEEFKNTFLSKLTDHLDGCGDMAAMSLNLVYTDWRLFKLPPDAPDLVKIELLTGVAKTLTLRSILQAMVLRKESQNSTTNRRAVLKESVEIFLYFETKLKNQLGLITAINDMLNPGIGNNTTVIDEKELLEEFNKSYENTLVNLREFENLLEHNKKYGIAYKQEKAAKENTFQMRREALDAKTHPNAKPAPLTSEQYNTRSKALAAELRVAMTLLKKNYLNKIQLAS